MMPNEVVKRRVRTLEVTRSLGRNERLTEQCLVMINAQL
jgi:hypothetical protein